MGKECPQRVHCAPPLAATPAILGAPYHADEVPLQAHQVVHAHVEQRVHVAWSNGFGEPNTIHVQSHWEAGPTLSQGCLPCWVAAK
eukprot:4842710-Lingulodinium_polyedra.AAC.1